METTQSWAAVILGIISLILLYLNRKNAIIKEEVETNRNAVEAASDALIAKDEKIAELREQIVRNAIASNTTGDTANRLRYPSVKDSDDT
jgi:hypothetical protein